MSSEWRFGAIGTAWSIGTPDLIGHELRAAITSRIERFDRTWSRFRDDATIQALRHERAVDLGPDAPAILAVYDRLFALTSGAMSPLVGGALEQLGYGSGYTLTPSGEPVRVPSWADCELDGTVLHVPGPVVLDIGAVGKGWLAGEVAAMVDGPCVVDASGDLVNRSGDVLRVALEDPHDPELAIGVVEVPDGAALCGSASNRRRWSDDLHHVLDARSGRPARQIVAAWAGGPDAGWSDGLATAAFFAAELPTEGHWWAALDRDRRLVAQGLPGEAFA
jgi:thiamine biosynthesis lipoprotein